MKDERIVKLLRERNEKGLIKLVEHYDQLMKYIITGILGSRSCDVEECLNDTYFKIWKHAERIDLKKASLKTYLKAVARNTALNRLRDISRKEAYVSEDNSDTLLESYVDQYQNIENRIILQEDVRLLENVIINLKEKDRELVIRRYFYLQKSKEIATAMDMTVTAVDSKLSRLRDRIKAEFIKGDHKDE